MDHGKRMAHQRSLFGRLVIPAKAGIQPESRVCGDMSLFRAAARNGLDSRLRGNDGSLDMCAI